MSSTPPGRHFVFLGGLHRSGTSLLFRMLRDHPDFSGFRNTGVSEDEGQLLQSVYPPARQYGGPGRFGFDPASFLDETSPLVGDANRSRLFSEWSAHWDLGKAVLLEKSPPNLVRTRFLQALFPNSQFVMLLRHPIAVALATQKWSKSSMVDLVEHWLLCHERFASDRVHVRNLFTLKYEQLVSDPDGWMKRLYAFLRVHPAPTGESVQQDVNERYFARWRAAVAGARDAAIPARMEEWEPRVNRFGYSLVNLDRVDSPPPDYFRSD